jgi:hypothetical protein
MLASLDTFDVFADRFRRCDYSFWERLFTLVNDLFVVVQIL